MAAARPRFIQVQTKHLDHSGDCIGGIRWTRTTTLPPSRKSEGSMLHLPGVFGYLTCLHGEVMGTYQGSLGHFGPRGPDRPRAGACRGLGPGPGPRARDGPGPKGSQREDKAGARPIPTPGIPWQVHAGAHCSANVVSDTQKTFKKSGNVQLFVDFKSFTFVLQPSLCPGLMCVGTLGLGNRRAREP